MRHVLADLATPTIAALLLLGSLLFAWVRSERLVVTRETDILERDDLAPGQAFDWRPLGARTYIANCMACHGADGEGWDQYPGFADTSRLAAAPGGRTYLIDLHLHGVTSPRWRAPMPSMGHLTNIEVAAVINHVLTRFADAEEAADLMPADIAARRVPELSPDEVGKKRP